MRRKPPVPFSRKFPNVDPLALRLLERLIAFDPKDRPTAEEALADPYFHGLANVDCEPSSEPISKLEFEFERKNLNKDDVRELIYREILEYHPQMLQEYLRGGEQTSFMYPSGIDRFKRQFVHLEDHYGRGEKSTALQRKQVSLPRERVPAPKDDIADKTDGSEGHVPDVASLSLHGPPEGDTVRQNEQSKVRERSLIKSATMSGSKCVGVEGGGPKQEEPIAEVDGETADGV